MSWRAKLNGRYKIRENAVWASGCVTGPRVVVFHESVRERKSRTSKMTQEECRMELEQMQATDARKSAALARGLTEIEWLREELEAIGSQQVH